MHRCFFFFFFFQAEDGIRDYKVTGVQTCALPILGALASDLPEALTVGRERTYLEFFFMNGIDQAGAFSDGDIREYVRAYSQPGARSEERRVGKECRSWGAVCGERKKRRDEWCGTG